MMTPEDAINKLKELESPEEIRRLFVDLGIKAAPAESKFCAIAEYAFRETGCRPAVYRYGGDFSSWITGSRFNSSFHWSNTVPMMDFVTQFDQRRYPELIGAPEECGDES